MEKVINEIIKFSKDRDWDQFHSPENLAKAISIESGELLECFLWDGEHYDKQEVCDELADVFSSCFKLANKIGVDPEEIILNKIEKDKIKYPIEKCKGKNVKYDKL